MVRRQQAADRAVRPKVRSPGHPKFQRPVEVAFGVEIAKGLLPTEAAAVVGRSLPVGLRWFHNAGGIPPLDLLFHPSSRYLSFAECEDIALPTAQDKGVREIARTITRDPGTTSEGVESWLVDAPIDVKRHVLVSGAAPWVGRKAGQTVEVDWNGATMQLSDSVQGWPAAVSLADRLPETTPTR